MTILLSGGAGYIGTHVALELMSCGFSICIIDDLTNSKKQAIDIIEDLSGSKVHFYEADLRDAAMLDRVMSDHRIEGVIHLAGLKAVGESVEKPVLYFDVNLGSTITLLHAMQRHGVGRFVFSSSATVYGQPEHTPIPEGARLGPTNPYGQTKLMIEQMLTSVAASDPEFQAISLRYFNPVGAHESGRIGEDPKGIPNNLFPIIAQTAVGRRDKVMVFGNDWPTVDGTGVRDYIHVVDLARGHVAALTYLLDRDGAKGENKVVNLGTGQGTSVMQAIAAFGAASGRDIPFEIVGRRAGDIATCYAETALAKDLLGWTATEDLAAICRDHWAWQSRNPDGYV